MDGTLAPNAISSSHAYSSNVVLYEKYGGLIKRPWYKIIRDTFSLYFNHLFSISPNFFPLHYTVAAFRILQLVGPSLACQISNFWGADSFNFKVMSVLSVFFNMIPPIYRHDGAFYFFIIFLAVNLAFIIYMVMSAMVFRKVASLNSFSVKITNIILSSFHYLTFPVAFELSGQTLSCYAFNHHVTSFNTAKLALALISIIYCIIFTFIILKPIMETLFFRPASFLSITYIPQLLVFGETCLINFLFGLAANIDVPQIQGIIVLCCSVIYFIGLFIPFFLGGFVKPVITTSIILSGFVGCFTSLVVSIYLFLRKEGSIVILFIFIVGSFVFFILTRMAYSRLKASNLNLIDEIYANEEYFDRIQSVNKFIMVIKHGFQAAHPACLNWQLFKLGIDKFPNSRMVYFCFAKFVAIYPENTQNLVWIARTLRANEMHGPTVRTIKEQTSVISRQRESNLGPELKTKINSLMKELSSTKHKLRHVWDLVIQGNTSEMEIASNKAFKEIKETESMFARLFSQYPNNRFVSRQYARFCKEIEADFSLYSEMMEKTRLLQRGEIVNTDQALSLGMHAFPGIPKNNSIGTTDKFSEVSQSTSRTEPLDDNGEDLQPNEDQRNFLMKRIRTIRIPSTFISTICRFIIWIFLYLVPVIVGILYLSVYVTDLRPPLGFLYYVTELRSLAFQLAGFSLHHLYECIDPKYWLRMKEIGNVTLPYLGGSYSTKKQLIHVINRATTTLQNVMQFRKLANSNENIVEALNFLFGYSYHYYYFSNFNSTVVKIDKVSVQTAINDFVVQSRDIAEFDGPYYTDANRSNASFGYKIPFNESIVNTSIVFNMLYNTRFFDSHIDVVLNDIISYINEIQSVTKMHCFISLIIVVVVVIVINFSFLFAMIYWIDINKKEAYICLTSLPKNVVSNIAENLRTISKTNPSTDLEEAGSMELSKQEDNMMKLLATGSNGRVIFGKNLSIILCTIIVTAFEIYTAYLIVDIFESVSSELKEDAPHLYYIQGTYTMYFSCMYAVLCILANQTRAAPLGVSAFEMAYHVKNRAIRGDVFYNLARYGHTTGYHDPYHGFREAILNASDVFLCPDQYDRRGSFRDIINCYDADMTLMMVYPLATSKTTIFRNYTLFVNSTEPIIGDELMNEFVESVEELWSMVLCPIYNQLIEPMFDNIINVILQDLENKKFKNLGVIIGLLVVSFVLEIIVFVNIQTVENHIKQVLRLLMHCPTDVVLQTHKIMELLNGEFSSKQSDSASRNAAFFKEIVLNLPDIVFTTDSDGVIDSVNKSSSRIFMVADDKLIGIKLRQFIEDNFKGDIDKLFQLLTLTQQQQSQNLLLHLSHFNSKDGSHNENHQNTENNRDQTDPNGNYIILNYQRNDNTEINLEASVLMANNKTVFIARDITQIVRYNTLINAEKAKSDQLLASILPPHLVKRVQRGEKNISFAVQTATIVFMDIVEFTPWCGSLPADKVMMTLNLLFKKFDACAAKYSTMTKIKCIGDCYMGAGGVFDEINNPAQHAKDVVCFGLDSIDNVLVLNKEINEKLRIRVGINTGGPIVAGVLGMAKPTFEILGPAINMAQQMEHNGVPMQVHVSRSVYELIYGDAFMVRERGAIKVKSGTIITYLVSRNRQ
ncbi:Adenylate and Guanylate cyclase catalytic domain containing protein [Tritrichomonas foetus]|uniref:Adenylate and Guanylate cyclase catalytic domain containing protein n=1 Tax=Tritrichomonas foetus TaxID=1144522 RepID=A0A1J4K7V8_9EUKA|nr:Adenylate and Guanylate cyclase catalytic domain containing protein [Tritrichomonas foetus]|eukprot:OHT07082.1 Adenylate and Guanylate cyclase catalytic domain containing protein [Tritrichomonas foetus]